MPASCATKLGPCWPRASTLTSIASKGGTPSSLRRSTPTRRSSTPG
jgi:hypothetical protein